MYLIMCLCKYHNIQAVNRIILLYKRFVIYFTLFDFTSTENGHIRRKIKFDDVLYTNYL